MGDSTDTTIDSILSAQKRYFAEGRTRSIEARRDALAGLEKVLVSKRAAILAALAKDLGKPEVEAYLAEYFFLLQEVRLVRKKLKKWLKPKGVRSPVYFQPCSSELRHEPFGAVLVMAPWNYPIQLSLSPLIAAIAAGNTVILKPSEITTSCEQTLVEIIAESFDSELVSVVTGDAEVAEALLEKQFDFIFFTGSTQIGKVVAKKAAQHLTPTILELGGKCPCIVHPSADLETAARRILAGRFFNGGQTCFAPDFVVVHESVKAKLITEFQKVMESTPWPQEMSNIVSRKHYDRLQELVRSYSEKDPIKSGEDHAEALQMAPRIMTDVGWQDEVMKEEIFGPILPVLTFTDADDLLAQLNEYGSPLALYLFSDESAFDEKMMQSLRSGGVCINDTMKQGAQLNLPFGGVGESGHGRYRGKTGVRAFTYQRAVVKRGTWLPDFFELMPPYGDKIKWLKRFMG
ncbi:aldehyde dehydrogenase [Oceaniferula spumae]|uniref:Aldehyde dehydrogenase n=1 Tax=Oceaniferula spumae TaxID=2979115 RepID=A0AAT9FHJ7_9BACT